MTTCQNKQRPLVAICLGGGGAKTFAHLGVIDALKESKIPIDFLITCSAASTIGLLSAIGVPSMEILNEFKNGKVSMLTKRSIHKHILVKYLEQKGITDIGQVAIPISIVAVDLNCGTEKIFETGDPLMLALASSAYPGLCKPIKYQGHSLIDGGVLNPDPADVARKKVGSDGIVISVTLRMEFIEESPKSTLDVILKSIYLSSYKLRDDILGKNSDIVITPTNNLKISLNDWKKTFTGYFISNKIDKYYQDGYQETEKLIPKIQELLQAKKNIKDR
ncbi:MAG: patatin-like phospholipase family protein [Candidatus Peribacteraceae bacterium]|nr:patatin-like phospholipase family protein [Candidatus Peribacteraceae bacterium]